ncbi:hypothetical protein BGZ60DRAFT_514056 [Tricladium varicosporioides]|nr:hypothetical protein BGZ60DRAFT_514056 [Hymenoscyphus varicosporioides]
MPSIAQEPVSPLSSRKRKLDHHHNVDLQEKLSSPHLSRHTSFPDTTHIPTDTLTERRYTFPKLRRLHFHDSSKRQRIERASPEHDLPPSHNSDPHTHPTSHHASRAESPLVSPLSQPIPRRKIDLSPCHICYRKPGNHAELDSFADCESCGKRACYICIRQCLGSVAAVERDTEMVMGDGDWIGEETEYDGDVESAKGPGNSGNSVKLGGNVGHKNKICSRCCVERGSEGEVFCLGCVRAEEGG